jgi:DNA-binding XRE family transcriptional regulator
MALKELRIKAGYSSHENFAYDHDFSRKHYWAAEKGKPISLTYLIKILDVHKINLQDFFSEIYATKLKEFESR